MIYEIYIEGINKPIMRTMIYGLAINAFNLISVCVIGKCWLEHRTGEMSIWH